MKTVYLESPNYHKAGTLNLCKYGIKSVFLAGSISNAADWQAGVAEKLLPYFHVFNPRRAGFNSQFDEKEDRIQITWEDFYLKRADIILFNFRPETLAPITLFELGKMLMIKQRSWQKIYINICDGYERKNDVIIQTELIDPEVAKNNIHFNLNEMIKDIIKENA